MLLVLTCLMPTTCTREYRMRKHCFGARYQLCVICWVPPLLQLLHVTSRLLRDTQSAVQSALMTSSSWLSGDVMASEAHCHAFNRVAPTCQEVMVEQPSYSVLLAHAAAWQWSASQGFRFASCSHAQCVSSANGVLIRDFNLH